MDDVAEASWPGGWRSLDALARPVVEYPSFGVLLDFLMALDELKEIAKRHEAARLVRSSPSAKAGPPK